jgi:hypothetical protein
MLYLACFRAGAIYLPLNTGHTLPRSIISLVTRSLGSLCAIRPVEGMKPILGKVQKNVLRETYG